MGKQTKAKKPGNLGKGKVTPVQIAFIVDQFLSDNNYIQTRSIFRTEASTLISKTQSREAPKSLLTLGAILDEYICLKEQKTMVEHDKCWVEQEKCRVEMLMQSMRDLMSDYDNNNFGKIISPHSLFASETKSVSLITQPNTSNGSPAAHNPIVMNSVPIFANTITDPTNNSTPTTEHSINQKRKGQMLAPNVSPTAKRSCSQKPTRPLPIPGTNRSSQATNTNNSVQQFSAIQSTPHNHPPNGSSIQGSSVAKSLFKQPLSSPQTNTPGLKTPPKIFLSEAEKHVSPLQTSSIANSASNNSCHEITATNSPIISFETANVSPLKNVTYHSIEKNHYIHSFSPIKTNLKRLGKRDHVKGRLDFDGSNVHMSSEQPMTAGISLHGPNEKAEIFDMDIPNLDGFDEDFSFSELLVDMDLDSERVGFSCQPVLDPSTDSISGSTHESGDERSNAIQLPPSTVAEVLSEKDMNIEDPDSLTPVKSITKSIKIISLVKNRRNSLVDQENL